MADAILASSGIYQIRNVLNGKVYVGSAVSLARRMKEHRTRLAGGTHHSAKLQRAWDKYGADAFAFEVIELVHDHQALIGREQHWIDATTAHSNGYNVLPRAGNALGAKRSPESIEKMRAWQVGRKIGPMSAEHKASISAGHKGKVKSPEWLNNLAASLTGNVLSPETRAKISASVTGFKHTLEAKAKIAAASRARKRTPEEIQKSAESRRGLKRDPLSADHRAKISAAGAGRKQSDEWLAKRVESRRRTMLAKKLASAV